MITEYQKKIKSFKQYMNFYPATTPELKQIYNELGGDFNEIEEILDMNVGFDYVSRSNIHPLDIIIEHLSKKKVEGIIKIKRGNNDSIK